MIDNKTEATIKVVCISDTHNETDYLEIPKGDILIHAGDITDMGEKDGVIKFNNFLKNLDFKYKVVIAGNHDLTFDEEQYSFLIDRWHIKTKRKILLPKETKSLLTECIYLENSGIELFGYKFWGSPITPLFRNWGFNKKRGEEIKQYWDMIPDNTEILITHGPPQGILDICEKNGKMVNVGCEELYKAVTTRIKPLYHIFGHVHEGYGIIKQGNTTFINASTLTESYNPENKPIVFELNLKKPEI